MTTLNKRLAAALHRVLSSLRLSVASGLGPKSVNAWVVALLCVFSGAVMALEPKALQVVEGVELLPGGKAVEAPTPPSLPSIQDPRGMGERLRDAMPQVIGDGLSKAAQVVPESISDGVLFKKALRLLGPRENTKNPEGTDVWERIRRGFAIRNLEYPLVEQYTYTYAQKRMLKAGMERSKPYLFYVTEELEKRNMPTELALLPFIESSYNPQATSPQKAAGMWQFIPSTGKVFGLTQGRDFDARRDVLLSTKAALDYFQKLYNMFGDWHLAIIAYNWGEGSIDRAVKRARQNGLPTQFSTIHLPRETRHYLPRLQAVKNLVADPEFWNVSLPEIPNSPYFAKIVADSPMDLDLIKNFSGLKAEEFARLNPALKGTTIKPGQTLLLPTDTVDDFAEKFNDYEGEILTSRYRSTLTDKRATKAKTDKARARAKPAVSRPQNKKVPAVNKPEVKKTDKR